MPLKAEDQEFSRMLSSYERILIGAKRKDLDPILKSIQRFCSEENVHFQELSIEEIEILLRLKNEEIDLMMLTAICILMDNLSEAKLYYMRLEENMQESFKELPIYRLWENPVN